MLPVLLTRGRSTGDTTDLSVVSTGWDRLSCGRFEADERNEHAFEVVEYTHCVMNEIYMGVEHITDLNGYDHILCCWPWWRGRVWRMPGAWCFWRPFTLGRITLLLAGMGWVHADGA